MRPVEPVRQPGRGHRAVTTAEGPAEDGYGVGVVVPDPDVPGGWMESEGPRLRQRLSAPSAVAQVQPPHRRCPGTERGRASIGTRRVRPRREGLHGAPRLDLRRRGWFQRARLVDF